MRDTQSQAVGNGGQETKIILIKKNNTRMGEFFSKGYLTPRNRLIQLDIFTLRFFKNLDVD